MYEQGRRQPDFEMLEAIADTFNVDMDYLVNESIDIENRKRALEFYSLYKNSSPEIRSAVELLLRSAQHAPESQQKN